MDGRHYIAKATLSSRAADGSSTVVATAGQTCEKVAASSLPWLLEQGYIAPSPASTATPAAMPASSDGPASPASDEAVH